MLGADLASIIRSGWDLLEQGASNRRSMMHTPVVASIDQHGLPDQRVMVLREADRDRRLLRFHTDIRSPKVGQIGDGAPVHILAYEGDARVQLRMSGLGRVVSDGPEADVAWAESSLFARRCYLAEHGPGSQSGEPTSGLPTQVEGRKPSEDQVAPGRKNFAVLMVRIDCMDWFSLAQAGHRRALVEWQNGVPHGRWLVP